MAHYQFTIKLVSDAEPGTGLGGEIVNDLIPRDHRRRPVIQASHIKGLMRDGLEAICRYRSWSRDVVANVFGYEDSSDPEAEALIRLTDAVCNAEPSIKFVTRTAISEESGSAKDKSLRTTEAIGTGSNFHGELYASTEKDSPDDLAWRLALLSIGELGGNRNRGCGECVLSIAGETRRPGELLRELDKLQKAAESGTPRSRTMPTSRPGPTTLSSTPTVLRLVFVATSPVCCPEITDKTNFLSSGFSIPASAVQGAILTRINRTHPDLATALFNSPSFRAWPLLPCHPAIESEEDMPASLPTPIRVSLTHRAAKFTLSGDYSNRHFFDEAFDQAPEDWRTVADGAPLKASDGVLLSYSDRSSRLWKASSMPRVVTSHGVHSDPNTADGRNLFTVEAMAPIVWQGLLVVPNNVAEQILGLIESDPMFAFGKSRTVRGLGRLRATIDDTPAEWQTRTDKTVLVAQSPILLDSQRQPSESAQSEFARLASQWAEQFSLPEPDHVDVWANQGIMFGWSRHDRERTSNGKKYQAACRVLLPGSVIAFRGKLDADQLKLALIHGLGRDGRTRGFGAVSVHPGKAEGLFSGTDGTSLHRTVGDTTRRDAIRFVLDLHRREKGSLPSPSQIRAVQERLAKHGRDEALTFLKNQTERTSRIWFTWQNIVQDIEQLMKNHQPEAAVQALEVLADLVIADQKENR